MIPARAGSKRVTGKNVRPFMGVPLVVWSVRAALTSSLVDRVVVSTDDAQVVAAVEGYPVTVMPRPADLATDTASTDDVLADVDRTLGGAAGGPELMVLLQATSPLREQGLVDTAVERMRQAPEAARLVEVTHQALFTGRVAGGWWDPAFPEDTRSQDLPALWYPTGRLYVYRCGAWFESAAAREERALALEAPRDRCINIDHESDFLWAEHVYRRFHSEYAFLESPADRSSRH